MKLLVVMAAMLSMSASAGVVRGFTEFKCTAATVKISLVEGKTDDVVVSVGGLQKNYDFSEIRYMKEDVVVREPLPSYTRKKDFTRIIFRNPDNTFYDYELYVIEVPGNLVNAKDSVTVNGTIQKMVIPYGVGGLRIPVKSPELAVSCKFKPVAK